MINGSIQEKNGCLYAVLRIPTGEGKTKQKWVNMGMKSTEPKRKKRERFDEIRIQYSDIANLEAVETRFCDFIVKWNEETKEDNMEYFLNLLEGYITSGNDTDDKQLGMSRFSYSTKDVALLAINNTIKLMLSQI